jgi:hypothetical protein
MAVHLGGASGLLWAVTDNEIARALRRCRRRLYALGAALVVVPVILSVLAVAAVRSIQRG